jgi:hypothetical protein
MENKNIQSIVKTINQLTKSGKFMDAIEFAEEEGLDKKLPEIYLKMEKAGAMVPGYAGRDSERFGYLSAAIRYNREWAENNPRIQKNLERLENWVLKSEKEIKEIDNYYIPSLLLEDAEQTGNSFDRNAHKKKTILVKEGQEHLEEFNLQNYRQN